MKILPTACAAVLALWAAGGWSKTQAQKGYEFPQDAPVKVIIMRPDVEVGTLNAGGIEEVNADWTAKARANLAADLTSNLRSKGADSADMPEGEGADAKTIDDYQKLFRAITAAIYQHKFIPYNGLPTKKGKFDWTLGPGAARLGELSGGTHALMVFSHDDYSSSDRKMALVGSAVMCGLTRGFVCRQGQFTGVHFYYSALVDLKSGDIVWFNYLPTAHGDIRNPTGSQELVDDLLSSMPKRHVDKPKT